MINFCLHDFDILKVALKLMIIFEKENSINGSSFVVSQLISVVFNSR